MLRRRVCNLMACFYPPFWRWEPRLQTSSHVVYVPGSMTLGRWESMQVIEGWPSLSKVWWRSRPVLWLCEDSDLWGACGCPSLVRWCLEHLECCSGPYLVCLNLPQWWTQTRTACSGAQPFVLDHHGVHHPPLRVQCLSCHISCLWWMSTASYMWSPLWSYHWRNCCMLTCIPTAYNAETAERNSTKLDRKQDLNVLYQVCIFWADQKNKMAALASDWLRHFRLLLWNRWTELNKTWQEARSQRPLPSLCFSGRSEKQDGRPGLWLAEIFSTSPLKPLNGIKKNLTGSKISTSSTKLVFFGPIGKTRWPPWPLIGWDIFDFSSETAERNWTKLDRKQDLNVLYQVCVLGLIGKIRCRPGQYVKKVAHCTQVHDMWPFGPLVFYFTTHHSVFLLFRV